MAPAKQRDARSISEMRNLGPACERDLNAAGITTAQQLIDLGAEDAFVKILLARKAQNKSTKCCNAAYLYALYGAIHDIDRRDLPAAKKTAFKKLTAEMRECGQFA